MDKPASMDPPTAFDASGNITWDKEDTESSEPVVNVENPSSETYHTDHSSAVTERFPSWLPEDQRYMKGEAVGPTDSMLVVDEVVDVPMSSFPAKPQKKQAGMSPFTTSQTASATQEDSTPYDPSFGTVVIGTNHPIPVAVEASAHLVEDERAAKEHVGSQEVECLPNTGTPGGRSLCFGITLVLVLGAVVTVGIVCGGGTCTPTSPSPLTPTPSPVGTSWPSKAPSEEPSMSSSGFPSAAPSRFRSGKL